jgi:serine/threonine protein kinase
MAGGPGPSTVAAEPDFSDDAPARAPRERPTWGLAEGDAIAPGRTVLRRLGGGRRYEVFLVWDEHRLAVLVAKLLRPDAVASRHGRHELVQEAEALGALAHPVLLRGFDAIADGRFPHLLVEHLEGPTLRELIDDHGPLALEQVVPLGLHVASALHYMAREGWVHLDVKPDNVVMGVPPRLIDLSVARGLRRAERPSGPVGTDAYMAPEQAHPAARGGRDVPVGPPADVFGLGATLHHALAGRPPFPRAAGARNAADSTVRFPQLVRGPEPLGRRVPAGLAALVRAALDPEPAARPTAAELAAGLEPFAVRRRRRLRR